jgi:hypothetical protein
VVGTPLKFGAAWAANDLAALTDGAAVVTDASVTLPTAATLMRIGRQDAFNVTTMHLRQLTFLPRRITNAELQERTS